MRTIIFPVVLLLGCLRLSAAPSAVDAWLDSLNALHEYREVALSPDHARVAWIETSPGKTASDPATFAVYVKELRDPSYNGKHIGDAAPRVQGLTWSQDGRLAFLSDADSHGQSPIPRSLSCQPITR